MHMLGYFKYNKVWDVILENRTAVGTKNQNIVILFLLSFFCSLSVSMYFVT